MSLFPPDSPYRLLARSLDDLPNGFPPAKDDADLRLLAKLFTPQEAELVASLNPNLETANQIAERLNRDLREVTGMLRQMSQKGLILIGKTTEGRLGFGLMPFVVGIYEAQAGIIDTEMAQLFETYYQQAFAKTLVVQPQVHRVIPIGESIRNDMEIRPFENATEIIDSAASWGVVDCICRTQKKLIGKDCGHPIDVCMVLSQKPQAFDNSPRIHALTHSEAQQTLHRAADAGLVHCVSNHQDGLWYICNCCTCSCSILRGMSEMGIANVVAQSAFFAQVDEALCINCGACLEVCQFNALTQESGSLQVLTTRCVGCGLCIAACSQNALQLIRHDQQEPPKDEKAWGEARQTARKTAL